jgi:hypothetical protein
MIEGSGEKFLEIPFSSFSDAALAAAQFSCRPAQQSLSWCRFNAAPWRHADLIRTTEIFDAKARHHAERECIAARPCGRFGQCPDPDRRLAAQGVDPECHPGGEDRQMSQREILDLQGGAGAPAVRLEVLLTVTLVPLAAQDLLLGAVLPS